MISKDMTVVKKVQGMLQAQVFKGLLESNDIPVLLEYESAGPALGITVDGLGQVRILVPAQKAEEARQLLEAE